MKFSNSNFNCTRFSFRIPHFHLSRSLESGCQTKLPWQWIQQWKFMSIHVVWGEYNIYEKKSINLKTNQSWLLQGKLASAANDAWWSTRGVVMLTIWHGRHNLLTWKRPIKQHKKKIAKQKLSKERTSKKNQSTILLNTQCCCSP